MYTKVALRTVTLGRRKVPVGWLNVVGKYVTAAEKARDPFGLKGEENLELTIQGIYSAPPKKKNLETEETKARGREVDKIVNDVEDSKDDLTKKFGPMSKTRFEKILESDITAEAVYASPFGQIRFDKDNPVKYDGQFDEIHFEEPKTQEMEEGERERTRKVLSRFEDFTSSNEVDLRANSSSGISHYGGYSKVREGGHAVNIVGATDVKKEETILKKDTPSIELDEKPRYDGETEGAVDSSRTTKPASELVKLIRMKEKQQQDVGIEFKLGGKIATLSESIVNIEPKQHVPKVYNQFDWGGTTREDVWVYLRKQICFQNEYLVALNKPLGLPMHTATVACRHTVIDFLPELADFCRVKEIFPCHRLDKDTTGVLILAKSEKAAAAIKSKFANRSIIKQYLTIVKNCPPMREGTIKIPIGEGKIPNSSAFRAVLKPDLEKFNIRTMQKNCHEAITWFKVLKSQRYAAFVEVRPETGLTHQIRVHLAHGLSCPILGDHKYSHRDKMAPQRLHGEMLDRLKVEQSKVRHLPMHLHCSKLEFTMPDGFMSKNMHEPTFVHAKLPNFFYHTLKVLGFKN